MTALRFRRGGEKTSPASCRGQTSEWMSKTVNEWMNEWMNEWVINKWTNEYWINYWVNQWINDQSANQSTKSPDQSVSSRRLRGQRCTLRGIPLIHIKPIITTISHKRISFSGRRQARNNDVNRKNWVHRQWPISGPRLRTELFSGRRQARNNDVNRKTECTDSGPSADQD